MIINKLASVKKYFIFPLFLSAFKSPNSLILGHPTSPIKFSRYKTAELTPWVHEKNYPATGRKDKEY